METSKSLRVLYHLLGLIIHTFGFYWFHHVVAMDWRMYFLFFTLWTQAFGVIYFLLALVADFRSDCNRPRDLFFAMYFPATMLVASIFWGLYHYNQELIFPKEMEYRSLVILSNFSRLRFPRLLNHIQHTLPPIWTTIELFLVQHSYGWRDIE